MTNLSYQDALELLRYENSGRHPLEILGYEYSTRGSNRFREDRPNVVSQIERLIRESLEEAGVFPREHPGGDSLERLAGGVIVLHTSAEISVSQTIPVQYAFASMIEAIYSLIRARGDSVYVALDRPDGAEFQGGGTSAPRH
jgi:hypothetical protein